MIQPSDISVVLQGDIRGETLSAISSVRLGLPGARLILSTFPCIELESLRPLVDEVVVSTDPSSQVPFTFAGTTVNNVNRQITTTAAGFGYVTTPFALKLRTDCVLHSSAFLQLASAVRQADPNGSRLLVSSYFTRHPTGIACYACHVSDWFMFGTTDQMRKFWAVSLMTNEDATYFERHQHRCGSTLAATRFRARYTPEQHITVQYASSLGYQVPAYLNEFTPTIISNYQDCLARHFVVASPSELGFSLPKYTSAEKSLYQQIDCVFFGDWLELFALTTDEAAASMVACAMGYRPHLRLTKVLRVLLHPIRRLVSRIVLTKRRICRMFVSNSAPKTVQPTFTDQISAKT